MGAEFYRDAQEWRRVERVIDREQNRYRERITRRGPGGEIEVVRDIDRPLSEHQGQGTAKHRRPPGPGLDSEGTPPPRVQ